MARWDLFRSRAIFQSPGEIDIFWCLRTFLFFGHIFENFSKYVNSFEIWSKMILRNILRIDSVKFSCHLVGYRARYAWTSENHDGTLAREIAIVLVYQSQMHFGSASSYRSIFNTLWKHSECRTHFLEVVRQFGKSYKLASLNEHSWRRLGWRSTASQQV